MTDNSERRSVRLRWLFEALLSVLTALLVVSINTVTQTFPWAGRLYSLYLQHYYSPLPSNLHDYYGVAVASFLLVWSLAVALFLLLRATSRFSFTEAGLRTLGGAIAVAGFPLAALYTGRGLPFMGEAAFAIILAVLYACRRWPFSRGTGILLLILHFSFWSLGVLIDALRGVRVLDPWPGWLLLWPSWYWHRSTSEIKALIFQSFYPLLSLACTLVWIRYVKQSGAQPALPVPEPPSA